MKKLLLSIGIQLAFVCGAVAQVQTHIVGDTIRIHGNNGKGELILQNSTDSVNGFLFNKGTGKTEFRRGLIKINDTLYVIGADTLYLRNNSLFTDSIKTHNNKLWIDSVPIKLTKQNYNIPPSGIYDIISIGDSSLIYNSGRHNIGIGYQSLKKNLGGSFNTALGSYSLSRHVQGDNNTAVGYWALRSDSIGTYNVALGNAALDSNLMGIQNTAIGWGAIRTSLNGNNNVAVGLSAMYNSNGANANTAIGTSSLKYATGANNVAIGYQTAFYDSTGSNNVFVGTMAGINNKAGSSNILIGYQAGYSETGSNKLYIANSSTSTPLIGGDFSVPTLTFNGSVTTTGKQSFTSTITATGVTGPQTINTPSGTVNIAAGIASIIVTNNLVTTNSIIIPVIRTNDASAVIKNVVPMAGSFIINLTTTATAETSIGFIVYN